MASISTLIQEKLSMQLDSISWNKKFDLLALGAYMIDPEDSSKRVGKIFLIQLTLSKTDTEGRLFKIIQEVDISGVLDLKWDPEEQMKLAVATSNSFELFELHQENDDLNLYTLKLESRVQLKAMALYTQWINPQKLIYSDSEGIINVVVTEPLEIQSSVKVHDNLTWVVQHSASSDLVFSGSDEGMFTGFKLEDMQDEEKHYTKKFPVGVTSILFLKDNVLAIGSYDDTLRIFTIDCTSPIMLSLKKKIEFGGAVWRTIALPLKTTEDPNEDITNFHIIAACARNGIHVIDLNTSNWGYETVISCMDHEGFLAYGLDMKTTIHRDNSTKTYEIASCYFDNHQLHVWKFDVPPATNGTKL